jgi:SAM-dependent methyltransferase
MNIRSWPVLKKLRQTLTTTDSPKGSAATFSLDARWLCVQNKLKESKRILDLGCGNNPVAGAIVAVDRYVEPKERVFGAGALIDAEKMKARGIAFINTRIDGPLPFADKEFDFAYSHHAFEHVDHPDIACREILRVAESGVIITPSIFAETIFGRPYHKWLVMERGNTLLFFKKRPFEDRPFGDHPPWNTKAKTWMVNDQSNPFDILLNDGGWYCGRENMPRLAERLRRYWYSHSPVMEVIFLWNNTFEYHIYE